MEGDREKALEAGCQDYISKPINTRSFLGSLGALLVPEGDTTAPEPEPGPRTTFTPTIQSHPGGG
jgi:DNA-binding response OmpR family regulator